MQLESYGRYKAKLSLDYIASLRSRPNGKLILVSAITPTPAGEGKTTTTVGLADALNRIGKKAIICLREPSIGPVFGMKGGAAGGGYAQVVPMEDINLHFTGDFNAIALANNLLAALIDNHIHHGNELGFDLRRITWKRVVDISDRALREVVISLGGPANGYPRQDGFDIVVASEIMAIFCLATSLHDLKTRIGKIVVGYTREQKPVLASDLNAHGAMTALLKDAIKPNLVQTLENNPALIHGGPFANIAHGCNSVIATQAALKLGDYVVTEAGFGADLGAEKFIDIKCRKSGLRPDAVVIVATLRALKMHGGADQNELNIEDLKALEKGIPNLERHVNNVHNHFGLPCVVAVNHFSFDTEAELALLKRKMAHHGVPVVLARHWAEGGQGRRSAGACRGRADRDDADRFPFRLRGRSAFVGQGDGGGDQNLRRERSDRRFEDPRADQKTAGGRLRTLPDLHREDAVFVFDRPVAARRAKWARDQHSRSAPRGGRRVHRDGVRRHHDDAGVAEGAVGCGDRCGRVRSHRRVVLTLSRNGVSAISFRPKSLQKATDRKETRLCQRNRTGDPVLLSIDVQLARRNRI